MKTYFYLFFTLLVACKTSTAPTSSAKTTIDSSSSFDNDLQTITIDAFTSGMAKYSGYFPFYHDHLSGRIYLEVDKINSEFLYVNALTAGVGSNDIGLDRGQLGRERILKFVQHGPKLLLIQPNYDYRAVSNNQDEVNSVSEAFASSVLAAFDVLVKEDWSVLIDLTDFIIRDSHRISQRLTQTNQGSYKLDRSRSVLYMENTRNFPQNTEFEALLTFDGEPKGDWIKSVVPSPEALSVRVHHSFIELPDSGYQPREFDPRSGFIHIAYQDYATPIDQPLTKRFILRHRLQKENPGESVSKAIEPIVYYLDRGAPEPIRSALMDGARWWNEAFEAAGFQDAFKVELLPEGVHPLDVRYNVIQWVHRSTRGWSYGTSVIDPRTGEILKGHVSLGSLRVRQDFLIAEGLLNPYDGGKRNDTMKEMALARLRQLAAHEVGHTIGLVHNYAASFNDRASVMDYPHPYVQLDNEGKIDLSDAYEVGIGEWDKVAIQYGYSEFESDQESASLNEILSNAHEKGLLYITDRDARDPAGAHPVAHLWDNGRDAAAELNRMMRIRRKVLNSFSEKSIPAGTPYSSIEETLVPVYLFHRYQVDAASKVLGGLNYTYAVKGDGQEVTSLLDPELQKKALSALLNTLSPAQLGLSESLLAKIPPKAHGYARSRETFGSKTGPAFDYYAAIETASDITLFYLLHAERANRLVTLKTREKTQPGIHYVLDEVIRQTWKTPEKNRHLRRVSHIIQNRVLEHLFQLGSNEDAYSDVKAAVFLKLKDLESYAKSQSLSKNEFDKAHYQLASEKINTYLKNPKAHKSGQKAKAPDGSPIGSGELFQMGCFR
ncbi:MAG: zinc-dependent metalloprotease [Cyclobacteriaceae bacterium]|nr:zinc-dependent metalloprotease [Cyclobacteriaceae bacterium HetDA_MAG_MS6]